jgi:hypothetical protein
MLLAVFFASSLHQFIGEISEGNEFDDCVEVAARVGACSGVEVDEKTETGIDWPASDALQQLCLNLFDLSRSDKKYETYL